MDSGTAVASDSRPWSAGTLHVNVYLFDIDGTLVSSDGAGKAAMEAGLASAFGVKDGFADIRYSGRTARAIACDLFRRYRIEESLFELGVLRSGVPGPPPGLPGSTPRPRPSGRPVLAGSVLGGRDDVLLGLITGNPRAAARIKLTHFGLFHHFTVGGFGDTHLHRDDVAREAMAAVRQRLGGPWNGRNVWVIGDTPLDIQSARAIDARAAVVATGWYSLDQLQAAGPDLLLPDLSDPSRLLK